MSTEITDDKDTAEPQGLPASATGQARRWPGWLPLMLFSVAALAFRPHLPAWGFMWTLSAAIYAGCKWLTWWQGRAQGISAGWGRSLGYLLAWPGMDPPAFLGSTTRPSKPTPKDWSVATMKTLLGAGLFWGAARMLPQQPLLLVGWVGMMGVIFLMHFGSFHLVALFWQRVGVDAQPIMRTPALATSLADFWGSRWNLGFRQLAHELVFEPLRPQLGMGGATLAVFLVSGLLHESVISLPAGGGYGLPTGYFLLQGLGLLVERSPLGKRLGLRRGPAGWLFTLLFTAAPAFWLFHPLFVTRVILPMMRAMGAL